MKGFRIENKGSGTDFGIWQGEDKEDALLNLFRAVGAEQKINLGDWIIVEDLSDKTKAELLYTLASEELDDLVLDIKAEEACMINNSGVTEQVDFLIETVGIKQLWNMFGKQINDNEKE